MDVHEPLKILESSVPSNDVGSRDRWEGEEGTLNEESQGPAGRLTWGTVGPCSHVQPWTPTSLWKKPLGMRGETTAGVLSVALERGWRREAGKAGRMTGQVPSFCRAGCGEELASGGGASSGGFLSSVASLQTHSLTLFTHGKETRSTKLGPV